MKVYFGNNGKVLLTNDSGKGMEISTSEFWEICRFGRELDTKGEVEEYLTQLDEINGIKASDIESNKELLDKIIDKVIDIRIGRENGDQIYDVICECLSDDEVEKTSLRHNSSFSKEELEQVVDEMAHTIRGYGVDQGSRYYDLKSFELFGEKFKLYCELFKQKDFADSDLYYGIYYAVEFDGGDNVFSDWEYTKALDVNELKKVVFELANRDYSDIIQRTIELSDIGLDTDTLKCLSDMRFKTLADVVSVGKAGLECVFPQAVSARMCEDVISKFSELGIEVPEGYEKTQDIIKGVDASRLTSNSKVVIEVAEKELGETVWVNPDYTDVAGFKEPCVCVDVVYDFNPCDAVEMFKELDFWCTSRINAVTLANAISQEYGIPVENLLREESSLESVLAEAKDRSENKSDKNEFGKSGVEIEK